MWEVFIPESFVGQSVLSKLMLGGGKLLTHKALLVQHTVTTKCERDTTPWMFLSGSVWFSQSCLLGNTC